MNKGEFKYFRKGVTMTPMNLVIIVTYSATFLINGAYCQKDKDLANDSDKPPQHIPGGFNKGNVNEKDTGNPFPPPPPLEQRPSSQFPIGDEEVPSSSLPSPHGGNPPVSGPNDPDTRLPKVPVVPLTVTGSPPVGSPPSAQPPLSFPIGRAGAGDSDQAHNSRVPATPRTPLTPPPHGPTVGGDSHEDELQGTSDHDTESSTENSNFDPTRQTDGTKGTAPSTGGTDGIRTGNPDHDDQNGLGGEASHGRNIVIGHAPSPAPNNPVNLPSSGLSSSTDAFTTSDFNDSRLNASDSTDSANHTMTNQSLTASSGKSVTPSARVEGNRTTIASNGSSTTIPTPAVFIPEDDDANPENIGGSRGLHRTSTTERPDGEFFIERVPSAANFSEETNSTIPTPPPFIPEEIIPIGRTATTKSSTIPTPPDFEEEGDGNLTTTRSWLGLAGSRHGLKNLSMLNETDFDVHDGMNVTMDSNSSTTLPFNGTAGWFTGSTISPPSTMTTSPGELGMNSSWIQGHAMFRNESNGTDVNNNVTDFGSNETRTTKHLLGVSMTSTTTEEPESEFGVPFGHRHGMTTSPNSEATEMSTMKSDMTTMSSTIAPTSFAHWQQMTYSLKIMPASGDEQFNDKFDKTTLQKPLNIALTEIFRKILGENFHDHEHTIQEPLKGSALVKGLVTTKESVDRKWVSDQFIARLATQRLSVDGHQLVVDPSSVHFDENTAAGLQQTPVNPNQPGVQETSSSGIPGWGVAVIVIVLIILVMGGVGYFMKRRGASSRRSRDEDYMPNDHPGPQINGKSYRPAANGNGSHVANGRDNYSGVNMYEMQDVREGQYNRGFQNDVHHANGAPYKHNPEIIVNESDTSMH